MADAKQITIDIRTAELIADAFLPTNPNKMRGAHPDVVAAAKAFKAAVAAALATKGA